MYGKIVNGLEYFMVFEGCIGKELDLKEYILICYFLDGWGGVGGNCGNDNIGGCLDCFIVGVVFLDGKMFLFIMVRGWYGWMVVVVWIFINGVLKYIWIFDSVVLGWEVYLGMGNYSVIVVDFDGDGCDEICVGVMIVDYDGKGLFIMGLCYGDVLYVGCFIFFC